MLPAGPAPLAPAALRITISGAWAHRPVVVHARLGEHRPASARSQQAAGLAESAAPARLLAAPLLTLTTAFGCCRSPAARATFGTAGPSASPCASWCQQVPEETQFLLLELAGGHGGYALMLPLIDGGTFRATLRGRCACWLVGVLCPPC